MKMLGGWEGIGLSWLAWTVVWGTSAGAADFYVATQGNDAWSGRLAEPNEAQTDGPFATLERARDAIRQLKQAGTLPPGGVTVEVRGGTYLRERPWELSAEDSGTETAPITYRARPGEEVRLVGGRAVTGWQPVTDPAVLNRLEESARGQVFQADLKALGITDFGEVAESGKRLELFFQDKPMRLARWPNEGFIQIADVLNLDPVDVRGTTGDRVGKFVYDSDRPERWVGEKDLWVHGYWFWDWAEQRHKVESLDLDRRIISVVPPYHGYGYRKGQWFYAFNALSELDRPGEWYLDRETGILYFYPPAPLEEGTAVVSILPTLVTLKEVSHVTLRGFILEAARGTAVTLEGGTGTQLVGCTLRNCGGWAVTISGGTKNGVVGCDIYEMGGGGIALSGGDRTTLTPAGHFAENNHIHHYARWDRVYQPGITLQGVGQRAAHNLIHNAPHMGMGFGGNDHLIEFNEIHSVCYESNDAGAIYTGRDWTMRGTVIRHNYLHHINGFRGQGCVGVYLDDMFCGTLIYGNVFYRVTMAAFIGGGRDCGIENNIFVDCNPAVHIDARALGWASYHAQMWIQEGREKGTLSGIAYNQPPYSERYPELVNILEEDPAAPRGNWVVRNVCQGGTWDHVEEKARPLVRFEDNLVGEDPHFVDAEHLNFQLKADSPAYKLGFQRIPIEQIGLYPSADRASWPVEHTVREESPPRSEAAMAPPRPVFRVHRTAAPVSIDGIIAPEEWDGADPARAMVIEQGIQGETIPLRSLAWLAYDEKALRVAIDNAVDPWTPLRPGNRWGSDDAVEIALRNPAAADAPILVLRGFPSGHFESSDEAGAPEAAVRRAAEGVEYRAKVRDSGRWSAEWRIPWASLGLDPSQVRKLAFNLSVRKSAAPLWLMWQGTGGYTWQVDKAGFIELV